MEILETETDYIPVITVFISGLFGLIVAIVTWNLANRRENRKFKQELALKDYKEKEELYISILTTLDKTIRFTKIGKNYEELFDDFTFVTAKSQLIATKKINNKFKEISEIMYIWSTNYNQSLPKKIKNTDFGITSNIDFKHREKANEFFPILTKAINELVIEIQNELNILKKKLV